MYSSLIISSFQQFVFTYKLFTSSLQKKFVNSCKCSSFSFSIFETRFSFAPNSAALFYHQGNQLWKNNIIHHFIFFLCISRSRSAPAKFNSAPNSNFYSINNFSTLFWCCNLSVDCDTTTFCTFKSFCRSNSFLLAISLPSSRSLLILFFITSKEPSNTSDDTLTCLTRQSF